MTKIRKVYLPKWMSWFGLIFLVPTWLWISYRLLVQGRDGDLGFPGWMIMTVVILGATVVIFLMGYRKLPAYVIEEEEQEAGES